MNRGPLFGNVFPLTSAQREIWVSQALHGDAPVYKIGGYARIDGHIDAGLFERAVNLLIEKHDALRTVLVASGDESGIPDQAIVETMTVPVPMHDLTASADPQAAAEAWVEAQLRTPFPLNGCEPLFRFELLKLGEQQYAVVLNFHHLIVDGWAIGLLVGSLGQIYSALLDGSEESALTAPSYAEIAAQDRAYHASPQYERQRAYWREKYREVPDPLFIPADREHDGANAASSGHHRLALPRAFYERMVEFARARESTPFQVILGLLLTYYARTLQRDEIAVGVPILNRSNARARETVGMCAAVSPVRLPFDGTMPFDALLARIGSVLKQDYRHQRFPLSELNRAIDLWKSQRAQVFDLSVSYERDDYDIRFGTSRAQIFKLSNGHEQIPLTVHVRENRFDDHAWIHFIYNHAWFDSAEIEAVGARLLSMLEQVLDAPSTPAGRLMLATVEEQRLLSRWASPGKTFDADGTIHRRFEEVVGRTPDATALLHDGKSVSYGGLNARANRLAHHLIRCGVCPEDRVALCAERGVEMIVGLLAILKAGGGYVPLDPASPPERLAWMLDDSAPAAVLVQATTRARMGGTAAPLIDLDDPRWLGVDAEDEAAVNPSVPGLHPRCLAYVIYTSGSTGRPKGVMVEHHSVVRLFLATQEWFDFCPDDVWALFHSVAFDVSVWEIWGALLCGARLLIVPHLTSRSPHDCYALLCDAGVTVLIQTPGALRQLIAAQGEMERTHRLRQVIWGGETLNLADLKPWFERPANTDTRLVNAYGVTETTVLSTYRAITPSDVLNPARQAVNCIGGPMPDLQVYVLDALQQLVPVGVAGELYVGGPSVARGYLNRPELTAARFITNPFAGGADERLYRSGDIARWLPDGTLEYLGRNDDQVKIRGFRIELGEIETALLSAEGIKEAAVLAREDGRRGDKQLVAYYVGAQREPASLRAHLAARLPEYMVPAAYVALDRLPLTLNGKLDRRALPAPDVDTYSQRAYEPPRSGAEQVTARVWAELLDVEQVGRNDNFFALGGHSLLAVRAIGRLRQVFGDSATLRCLFETPDLATFAARLSEQDAAVGGTWYVPPAPLARTDPFPLSYVQERLWLIQQRDGGRAYNMHGALALNGPLSLPALRAAFDALVARHEPLRTRFDFVAGADTPSQFIDTQRAAHFEVHEIAQDDLQAELARHADVVFDLQRDPLLQVRVLRIGPTRHVVSLVMHHIISDGWSLSVLVADLRAFYAARVKGEAPAGLQPLAIQYADHAWWQRQRNPQDEIAFWQATLAGYDTPLDLTLAGTPEGTGHGALVVVSRPLPQDLATALAQLARQRGTSLFAVFLAALAVLCHRQTGRTDLCLGTTTAGRDNPLLEPLIGFFINILPLRLNLAGDPSGADLVDQAHRVLLDALEHQALAFERMLAEVPGFRQTDGRSSVPIVVRHQTLPPIDAANWGDGLVFEQMPETTQRQAQSALDLEIFGEGSEIKLVANFDSRQFDRAHIELMLDVLQDLLTRFSESLDLPLSALRAITPAEAGLLQRAQGPVRVMEPIGIAGLFAVQVTERSNALACCFEDQAVTYAELDSRANRIAHALRDRGIGPRMRVAIYHPRSVDFLAAMLAVFKLNCVYVPIDPAYPAAYAARLLADAQPAMVVASSASAAVLHDTSVAVLRLDADVPGGDSVPFAAETAQPTDLAYIAYTSGSTGLPKGVMVEHRQVLNCLHALWERTPYAADEVVGQKTSMSFVPSIKEMLSGLLAGVPQVIFPDSVVKDAPVFAAAIRTHRVTRLNLVPSHLAALLDHAEHLGSLRHVTTAGEPLSRRLAERVAQALPGVRLHNNYGCSELNDITYAAGDELAGATTVIPAGRPIANCRVHVLDNALMPVPVGAVGSIFVEGASVGPGYWNQPELSAERFVLHPHGARMLRTGDIGQWLPDGRLLHRGREDYQIKVRGQRVELPAVELAMTSHPGIDAAAASGIADEGTQQLVGFYVPRAGAHVSPNELHAWLADRLPAAMVPSCFIALDALPLLPNGKLNRLALASLDVLDVHFAAGLPDLDADDAPQGAIEEAIARIWRDCLGVERIGRHDNFFALGGHSLMAARVAARVGAELGVRVTVRSLFDTRTVHRLACMIAAGRATSAQVADVAMAADNDAVALGMAYVAFNTSGTQSPLFLAHTLQGYSWYFEHLAAHVDPDIPVYGLPPLPLGEPQPRTLSALAARFVRVIKDLQPTGPYRLAGWSFGGLVAYEIAAQLTGQGDDIEFLGLFDTTLPGWATAVDPHQAARLTLRSFALGNFTGFDENTIDFDGAADIETLIGELVQAIEDRRATGAPLWHLAYDQANDNRLFLERLVAHGVAMAAWQPKQIGTRAYVFAAEDASITPLEGHPALPRFLGWDAVLDPADIEVLTVPGDHETIIKVHADVLGRHITDVLKRACLIE